MKHLFVFILGVVCCISIQAQSSVSDRFATTYAPIATNNVAAETFCKSLTKIMMDIPKNFDDVKGEVMVNNSLQKTWTSDIHLGNCASEEVKENSEGITWNAVVIKKVSQQEAANVHKQINTYIRGCKTIMNLQPEENAEISKTRGSAASIDSHTWTIVEPLEHPLVNTQIITTLQPESNNTWQAKLTIQKIK